jgi:hypothetical protein
LHRDKGQQARPGVRTKVILAVSETLRALHVPVVGATGTLLTNGPVEAFLPLQILGGNAILKALTPGASSAKSFLFRYCQTAEVWTGKRTVTTFKNADVSHLTELHNLLRANLYVRREKADLGAALPHGGWIVTPLALNGCLVKYKRIEREFLDLILETEGPESMWRKAKAETLTRMMALYEEAGVAKVSAAAEYIGDLVDEGRKVVAFYQHTAVFDGLLKALSDKGYKVCWLKGNMTPDLRAKAEHAFQDGTAQILLGQIDAAGVAVTLTASADAVFVQCPWSAGKLKQAADRILRADDRSMARAKNGEAVTFHVLQAFHEDGKPTFDSHIFGVLETKALVIDAVNAGKEVTIPQDSISETLLRHWYASA